MSVPPSPSSSLFVLRSNSSKSSLLSDTDDEDVQYASSSAVTTPEDDDQVFQLGRTLGEEKKHVPGTPTRDQRPKLGVETKPQRPLTLAMRRMKKAALSFAAFKKKRSDEMSPILLVTPLREKFGKSLSIRSNGSFYSTPNLRFSMKDLDALEDQKSTQTVGRRFDTISGTALTKSSSTLLVKTAFKRERGSGFRLADFADVPPGVVLSSKPPTPAIEKEEEEEAQVPVPETPPPTSKRHHHHDSTPPPTRTLFPFLVIRVLFFLPWCAAVGGALLLFPNHLDLVAFRPGYVSSPRTSLERFAHWAHFAAQHVVIFLGCVLLVLWYERTRTVGLSVTAGMVVRFVYVWWYVNVDRRVPLGEDDKQSLYLLATDGVFVEDTVVVRKQGGEVGVMKVYTEGGS